MQNLVLSFNIIAPLLLYMVIGAVCKRVGLITDEVRAKINKLLVKLIIPCSIFKNLYRADLSDMASASYVPYAVLGNMLFFFVTIFLAKRFMKDPARLGSFVQGATRGNGVIFGIPLCEAVFGVATPEMALTLAVLVPYYNTFEIVFIEVCGEKARLLREGTQGGSVKVNWGKIAKGLATNGILIGVALGLLFNYASIPVPEFLNTVITGIGGCVSPIAFIFAGAAFSFKAAGEDAKALSAAIVIKLIILPILFLILPIKWGWTNEVLLAMLVSFATPTAISSYPMAKAAGCDENLAAEIVAFTTGLSMFSIFLFIFVFKTMGIL